MNLRLLGITACAFAWTAAAHPDDLLTPSTPLEQAIDHYTDAGLKSAEVKAAPQADDANPLRRLTLDLNGRIPTSAELRAYLADAAPDKRAKLVERLFASPAFVRHQ